MRTRINPSQFFSTLKRKVVQGIRVLRQGSGFDLVEAEVFLAEPCDKRFNKCLCLIEHTGGGEEPDAIHQCIHRHDLVETVEALRKRFGVEKCSLAYELGVEFFTLRKLSIGQLSLREASLENEIAENRSGCTDDRAAERCKNAGYCVIHEVVPAILREPYL